SRTEGRRDEVPWRMRDPGRFPLCPAAHVSDGDLPRTPSRGATSHREHLCETATASILLRYHRRRTTRSGQSASFISRTRMTELKVWKVRRRVMAANFYSN